jgi:hypothetical protein
MSIIKTFDSDSTAIFDTDSCKEARPLGEKEKRTAEATRQRIPNKTQWSLDDMLRIAERARLEMGEIQKWIACERLDAKRKYDASRQARLGELDHLLCSLALQVAALERLASDARQGIYRGIQEEKDRPKKG